ncbi:MAG: transposase [Solirubrobacteraceae bacterium]
MEKVAPSERFRAELDEVLAGVAGDQDPIETVGRLGARLILQQALEDEVSEFLGRARYERAGEPVSHRNGYEPRTVKTTSGPVRLERPRVRNAAALGFESKVLGKGVARTHALESLVISGFLRGLSTRDIEAVWRRCSRRRSRPRAPSRGSARTPASATASGAGGGWRRTTSFTCSLMRST